MKVCDKTTPMNSSDGAFCSALVLARLQDVFLTEAFVCQCPFPSVGPFFRSTDGLAASFIATPPNRMPDILNPLIDSSSAISTSPASQLQRLLGSESTVIITCTVTNQVAFQPFGKTTTKTNRRLNNQ